MPATVAPILVTVEIETPAPCCKEARNRSGSQAFRLEPAAPRPPTGHYGDVDVERRKPRPQEPWRTDDRFDLPPQSFSIGADLPLENLLRCFALDEAGRIVDIGEGRVDVGGLLATAAHIRPAVLCERDRDFESGCLQRRVCTRGPTAIARSVSALC
jgi:hypothetical protein